MKDGGKTTKQMEKVDLFMQMEIFMMDTGRTIKLMALEFIVISMAQDTRDTGKKTNNTEKV